VTIAVNGTDSTKLDVTVNGLLHQYRVSDVKDIEVDLGGGNDSLTIAAGISIERDIKGGDGDDTLIAGGGDDKVDGGNGADTMTGGPGADQFKVDASDTVTDFVIGVDSMKTVLPKPTPIPPGKQNVRLDGNELKIKGTSNSDVVTVKINAPTR
jgi:Ca2+-binding RTX toxin-like protein